MKAMDEVSSPLYLRLICDQALGWKSFSEKRETYIATDLRKMISGRLKQKSGKIGKSLRKGFDLGCYLVELLGEERKVGGD